MEPLRIGVLGAARIAELAIVKPARATGDRIVAVAARDRRRAEAFAAQHGVERVVDSYSDVVSDPEVEVVYNPLANSHKADVATASSLPGVGQGHQVGDSQPGQFGCTFVSDTGDLLQRHIDLQAGDDGRPSPTCHRTIENAVAGKRHRLGVRNRTPAEADQWRTAGRADGHPNRDARSA
jgi:Oxidoreductase family, NAD-binding Rossmann fold